MFVSQQLKLNVIWVKNFLGFAVDQTIEKNFLPFNIVLSLATDRGLGATQVRARFKIMVKR